MIIRIVYYKAGSSRTKWDVIVTDDNKKVSILSLDHLVTKRKAESIAKQLSKKLRLAPEVLEKE